MITKGWGLQGKDGGREDANQKIQSLSFYLLHQILTVVNNNVCFQISKRIY